VLGNHDWWEEMEVQRRRAGPIKSRLALEKAGIPVYENDAIRLDKDGRPFWLAGLGDQWAFWPSSGPGRRGNETYFTGVDDLAATLAHIPAGDPTILMVHEPDIFPEVPASVSLTVAGHTHGGQVRVAGYAPFLPSKYGRRYMYGHIVEGGRDLIVSGGLGCSGLPVRFGSPPEIVVIDLSGNSALV
jgi:predicted MPP superfamily phosphohydrolase